MNISFRYTTIIIAAASVIFLIAGCKSPSVLTDESETIDFPDIVETDEPYVDSSDLVENKDDLDIYYTVQIGAYKIPLHADRALSAATARFNLNAKTEFDRKDSLHKITVGLFLEYDGASAFRERIKREYPREYEDSWIVEVTKDQKRIIP